MIMSLAILILSAALLGFYIQAATERILRRQFSLDSYQFMVKEYRLDFPSLMNESWQFEAGLEGTTARDRLLTDYIVLDYLLARVAYHHYTLAERLLRLRLRIGITTYRLLHYFAPRESRLVHLARMIQYFANVAGEEMLRSAALNS